MVSFAGNIGFGAQDRRQTSEGILMYGTETFIMQAAVSSSALQRSPHFEASFVQFYPVV